MNSLISIPLIFLLVHQDFSAADQFLTRPLYEKYESCLSMISKSQWDYSEGIYSQPHCFELLDFSADEIANMFHLKNPPQYSYFYDKECIKELPFSCQIGGGNGKHDHVSIDSMKIEDVHYPESAPYCKSRSFFERDFFVSPVTDLRQSGYHTINELKKLGVNRLVFVGDSLTQQTHKAFLCDSIRDGAHLRSQDFHGDFFEIITPLVTDLDDPELFSIELYRANWPGIPGSSIPGPDDDTKGPAPPDEEVEKQFLKELNVYAGPKKSESDKSKTVIVINAGIHRSPERQEGIPTLSRVMLNFSRERIEDTILMYRETFLQDFGYAVDGHYCKDPASCVMREDIPEKCCHRPQVFSRYGSDDYFVKMLKRLDPEWEHLIGWVRAQESSVHWATQHIEYDESTGHIDCSHYLYTPHMMSPVWKEIATEAHRVYKHHREEVARNRR